MLGFTAFTPTYGLLVAKLIGRMSPQGVIRRQRVPGETRSDNRWQVVSRRQLEFELKRGETMREKIDAVLKYAIEHGDAPGCAAIVLDRTSIRYAGAFGVRDLDARTPMTLDTVFRLASMTKAITSVAAMQLVERGRLHLDQPVASVLPVFGALGVLTGFYGDKPAIRPPRTPVTLRHLLTHTSGFAYEFWNAPLREWVRITGNPGVLSGKRAGLMTPLTCDPGAAWVYGISTDWVGQMVEAASGETLDKYLAANVLGPLGMAETCYEPTAAMNARMVGLSARDGDGLRAMPHAHPPAQEIWNGGHGLHSTAADYARFLQMLLNCGTLDGAHILQAKTVALMGENHIGDLLVTRLNTIAPNLVQDAEFFPGMRKTHGLAYMINCEQWPHRRAIGSGFWAGLFNTFFWIDPTHGIAGLLLMQVLPFADARVMAALDAFEEAVYSTTK